jgi:alpha-beta hydrolase superfamily lysophospholipase
MPSSVKQRSLLLRAIVWIVFTAALVTVGAVVFEWFQLASSQSDENFDWRALRVTALLLLNLCLTFLIASAFALYFWLRLSHSLPELQGWHLQSPESEFCGKQANGEYDFDDYLKQEELVFQELDAFITGPWATQNAGAYNRFNKDSICNPTSILEQNWNRSQVLECEKPIGGVLLVHGLSDSPYSLRKLGERLHAEGYTVIWLRVPGHGTNPHALAKVCWNDWTAAVKVAVTGLRSKLPNGLPLYLAGYSNGGALSVHYALSALDDDALPSVDAIVLLSPMIGINPLAKITRLMNAVGLISRNEKTKWSHIYAEIDPFKYSSWPMNANAQAWEATQGVEKKLAALQKSGRMNKIPPILAMQSAVDSTVSVPRLITALFARLKSENNELFLFDINRVDNLSNLVNFSFEKSILPALKQPDQCYRLSVLRNAAENSEQMVLNTRTQGEWQEKPIKGNWPDGVISLSHIALPIAPNDPVYGDEPHTAGLSLGSISMRAEPNALMIPSTLFVRCRQNPFYDLMENHVIDWLNITRQPSSQRQD